MIQLYLLALVFWFFLLRGGFRLYTEHRALTEFVRDVPYPWWMNLAFVLLAVGPAFGVMLLVVKVLDL